MGLLIVGHRANTIRRIRFYNKYSVDYVELDLTQRDDTLHVFHGVELTNKASKKEWIIIDIITRIQGGDRLFFRPLSLQDTVKWLEKIFAEMPGLWLDLKKANPSTVLKEIKRLTGLIPKSRHCKPIIVSGNDLLLLGQISSEDDLKKRVKVAVNVLHVNMPLEKILELARLAGAEIVSFNTETFNYQAASEIRKRGLSVGLWTVNSPSYVFSLGSSLSVVDYLITDRPDLVKELVL